MGQYLIRTQSGDKGPFSLGQLEELVAAGKIPVSMSVIETTSGLTVPLTDLILGPEVSGAVAPPAHEFATEEVTTAPPARAPRRGAPNRESPGRGRSTRGSSRRGAAPAAPDDPGRARYAPAKKSPVPLIVGIVIALALVGGAVFVFLQQPTETILEGRWEIDVEQSILGLVRAEPEVFGNMSPEDMREFRAGFETNVQGATFEFRLDQYSYRQGSSDQRGTFAIEDRDGARFRLRLKAQGGESGVRQASLSGDRLTIHVPAVESLRMVLVRRSP